MSIYAYMLMHMHGSVVVYIHTKAVGSCTPACLLNSADEPQTMPKCTVASHAFGLIN